MGNKKLNSLNALGGLVYSTDPNLVQKVEEQEAETLPIAKQNLRVFIDRKQRNGKTVTIIDAFIGSLEDLEQLGKKIKTKCGTGGAVKDGQIMIQGDYKLKIFDWLKEWGYQNTKMK